MLQRSSPVKRLDSSSTGRRPPPSLGTVTQQKEPQSHGIAMVPAWDHCRPICLAMDGYGATGTKGSTSPVAPRTRGATCAATPIQVRVGPTEDNRALVAPASNGDDDSRNMHSASRCFGGLAQKGLDRDIGLADIARHPQALSQRARRRTQWGPPGAGLRHNYSTTASAGR
ncbi:hypothetical protein ColTof3_04648 [Colletotrichum tofieldiae]|nr:hypothetical protein ColTof3_04648 [Colletotrichum tofieldiae]